MNCRSKVYGCTFVFIVSDIYYHIPYLENWLIYIAINNEWKCLFIKMWVLTQRYFLFLFLLILSVNTYCLWVTVSFLTTTIIVPVYSTPHQYDCNNILTDPQLPTIYPQLQTIYPNCSFFLISEIYVILTFKLLSVSLCLAN